jgi:hypothetical protein
MTIEEVKHADLQQAVKDINTVLGTTQNKVAGRQVLIDFIVGTIGGCIGPDPENPDEQIWTDERAGQLQAKTLATYEVLTDGAPAEGGEVAPTSAGAEAVEEQSPEVATAEAAGEPDPKTVKECPEFGKGYDATDPGCAKPCKRAEECQTVMAEATTAPVKKTRKTAEEKAAEKEAKKTEREAAKAQRAAEKAGGKTTTIKSQVERYGYVNAAHDAILSKDMSRDDLAKKILELYEAHGKTGDIKQARRNLDTDLRSLLVFGVVREENGLIILADRS